MFLQAQSLFASTTGSFLDHVKCGRFSLQNYNRDSAYRRNFQCLPGELEDVRWQCVGMSFSRLLRDQYKQPNTERGPQQSTTTGFHWWDFQLNRGCLANDYQQMKHARHGEAFQCLLNTGLLNGFSANVNQSSRVAAPQQIQELLGRDQNLDGSDADAWDMHGHGSQDCEGSKSLLHLLICVPPILTKLVSEAITEWGIFKEAGQETRQESKFAATQSYCKKRWSLYKRSSV